MKTSLARDSIGRLSADVAGLALGVLGGIVTARWLGPAGKGEYATISYLTNIFMLVAHLGLGEAAVVLVGRKQFSTQTAIAGTLGPALLLCAAGSGALWLTGRLLLAPSWASAHTLMLVACAGLPIAVLSTFGSYLLNCERRLDVVNRALLVNHFLVAAAVSVFIIGLHWGVLGGLLATIVGGSASSLLIVIALREQKLRVQLRQDPVYLREALRYGPKFMLSTILMGVSARPDLLLVQSMLGDRDTGFYSIALTISAMAGMVPGALANASFPHLANVDDAAAVATTNRICRVGLATALITSIAMAVSVPVVLPLLFGRRYAPAIVPTIVLISGSIFSSAEWLVCRAAAARGRMRPQFTAYIVTFAIMITLDVLFIPRYGIVGAAWASVVAPIVGFAVAVHEFNRDQPQKLGGTLLPRGADFVELWTRSLRLARGR